VAFWDGTRLEPSNGASASPLTFTLTDPAALRHLLIAPGQLGLGRAYTAGLLEVDDLDRVVRVFHHWKPPAPDPRLKARPVPRRRASGGARAGADPGDRGCGFAGGVTRRSATPRRSGTTTTFRPSSSGCSSARA
jgi:cyclopropane-fatty-acyl-phospholipid synthase